MTDKKKRQRGSRTHGGGSQKNRRGAGNRGGRGDAGREKHEFHGTDPLGRSGFTRAPEVQDEIAEIDVGRLDEDVLLLVAEGIAEEAEGGYRIDARDVVEDGHEVDSVKVLGGGQVRHELDVVADAFSATAVELIEDAGGSVERTEGSEDADGTTEQTDESED
jgi:large subunit ribosomal protein L15